MSSPTPAPSDVMQTIDTALYVAYGVFALVLLACALVLRGVVVRHPQRWMAAEDGYVGGVGVGVGVGVGPRTSGAYASVYD